MSVQLNSESSPILRVYIAKLRRHGRTAYGIRFQFGTQQIWAFGWAWSNQAAFVQMLALTCVMESLAECNFQEKIAVIMRTEYLRDRLAMYETRMTDAQHSKPRKPMKEDEQLWMRACHLKSLYCKGFATARSEEEQSELMRIERDLDDLFYKYPSPLKSADELSPEILLDYYRRDY